MGLGGAWISETSKLVAKPKAVQACADAARHASEVTERQYVEVLREQLECSN